MIKPKSESNVGQSPITLASASAIRATILKTHGVKFNIVKPGVDESVIKSEAADAGLNLEDVAMRLAEAKCMAVAEKQNGFVIGADQILEFEDRAYDKPRNMAQARARLAEMQGKPHTLINATVAALDGVVIWRHLERPRLSVRKMTGAQIDAYLEKVGEQVLSSVGAYMVETPEGAALFDRIDGDGFVVQGIAIYPLLAELRRRGAFGKAWTDITPVKAGVVGCPVSHSLSPLIHNEWARRASLCGHYDPIEVAPDYDAFAAAMDELRAQGFAGVNVTIPHKENALRYADRASRDAVTIGAANMLTFAANETVAENSDAAGFAKALAAQTKERAITTALVLGAGGAARGVIAALQVANCKRILIANRTREKADALAAEFDLEALDWSARSTALSDCDLLVNTTSLGMTGQPPLDIDLSRLPAAAVVFDIVYAPLATPLLEAACGRGNVAINGMEMLMHQAAPGFSTWFGGRPYPVFAQVDDPLRDLLVGALKKRTSQ